MKKKQKQKVIRIAVRLSILAALLVLIIGQYKSIHTLKNENRAIFESITAIETELEETLKFGVQKATVYKTERSE